MSLANRQSSPDRDADDAGRLSDSENSSSGHTSEDDEEGDGDDGHPMMSIFASYYGIEETVVVDNKPKGTIDDAGFQPESYVKNLLLKEPFENLVKQDTEMVQDIRTLDGEMQKLVYDNYNKFITATETIRVMKADVYGMDPDMEAVRLKMQQIAQGSQALDAVLHPTRCKVDKLVRVRRLLDRLGFLNELPERLEGMIHQQQYREAVQLYNKTISVLTRHSHVLSFHKIKERTEQMMRELTGKVINLLDDPSLEAVKLTQYVSVLRLMRAPTQQVFPKLLAAHKQRSLRMIMQFKQSLADSAAVTSFLSQADVHGKSASAEAVSAAQSAVNPNGKLDNIANARQFHQSMMVGLIEACKGVIELYAAPDGAGALTATSKAPAAAASSSSSSNNSSGDAEVDAERAAALAAEEEAGRRAEAAEEFAREASASYRALEAMIGSVMAEYTKSVLLAFQGFFKRYGEQYAERAIEYCDVDDLKPEHAAEIKLILQRAAKAHSGQAPSSRDASRDGPGHGSREAAGTPTAELLDAATATATTNASGSTVPGVGTSAAGEVPVEVLADGSEHSANQFRAFELQEECGSWFLLARQAVVDVMFLDSNQLECQAKLHMSTSTTSVSIGHSIGFAQQLTDVLSAHCDTVQQHRLHCYLRSVQHWLPRIAAFCNVKHTSSAASGSNAGVNDTGAGGVNVSNNGNLKQTGAPNSRPSVPNLAASVSTADASIQDRAVLRRHTQLVKQIMALLQRNAVMVFSDCAKDIKPVIEICEITSGDTAAVVLSQISKFCNRLTQGMEAVAGIANNRCTYESGTNTLVYAPGGEEADFIHSDAPVLGLEGSSGGKGPAHGAAEDVSELEGVQAPLRLLLTALLCNMLTSMMPQLNEELRLLELPNAEGNREFQMKCMARVEVCCQLMMRSFIDANARAASILYANVQYAAYQQYYAQLTSGGSGGGGGANSGNSGTSAAGKKLELSPRLLDLARMLDKLALMGCLVFSELPAHNTTTSKAGKGASDLQQQQRRASGRPAYSAIEADMDRLFARKVVVYDRVSLGDSTEAVLNTVLKASFKAALEACRSMTLPYQSYLYIQANALMLKQVAGNLLRDSSGCDNLADQILNTVFSRYVGANDISNASDANETTLISRAVSDAFGQLGALTVLVV